MQNLDHLVYAVPILKDGIKEIKTHFGVNPVLDIQCQATHKAWGTHNAIVSLGPTCYLDIVSVDPKQPAPEGHRPFGVDRVDLPKLTTWALKTTNIEEMIARAKEAGYPFSQPTEYSCKTSDGKTVKWKLAFHAHADTTGGLVPFLIDWGKAPHPAKTAPTGCKLISLSAEHPMPEKMHAIHSAMGIKMDIKKAFTPKLIASISTPKGEILLS